ncbi:MAG: hypothetical protein KF784_07225 [Fimbriimonadaceae bacterium]|nr:hypothetical protein [Fimbriimonadaceae bacterium]
MIWRSLCSIAVLAGLLFVVGCEDNKQTIKPGDNKITMSAAEAQAAAEAAGQEDPTLTLRSEEGTTTVSNAGPTELQLGVPFYPGSKAVEKQGLVTGSADVRMYHSKRTAIAKPKSVIEWYKEHVPSAEAVGESTLLFKISEGISGTISVKDHEGGSEISIVTIQTTKIAIPPPVDTKK